jgi:hypothetical protein
VNAVETTEKRKNFNAASPPRGSPRRSPTRTNAGSDTTSSATSNVSRSREAGSTSMPVTDISSRVWNSPGGTRPSPNSGSDSSSTTSSEARNSTWKNSVRSSVT